MVHQSPKLMRLSVFVQGIWVVLMLVQTGLHPPSYIEIVVEGDPQDLSALYYDRYDNSESALESKFGHLMLNMSGLGGNGRKSEAACICFTSTSSGRLHTPPDSP